MSPDTLASLLAANPYPGCAVTASPALVSLSFDGLVLNYHTDGWHFGDAHLESTLSEHSAPEQVHPEIRRILKLVMSLKVERALNEAEADGTTDPVEYLTNLAAEKMLAILDVAALANVRQAKIASTVAEAAARDTRIADLERDLADKDTSLKTACEALSQVHAITGGHGQGNPADAVEAVKTMRAAAESAEIRATQFEGDLCSIGLALDDAGAPAVYDMPDDTERTIPDPERIRILGDRVRGGRRERDRSSDDHTARCVEISNAHLALDDRSVPRHADGIALTLAARIRSTPC